MARYLRQAGWTCRVRRKRVKMFTHDAFARVSFARSMLRNLKEHPDVDFSDEVRVDTNDHGNRHQWCAPGERPRGLRTESHATALHLWGCIGVGFRMLVEFPPGSVDASMYRAMCLTPYTRKRKSHAGIAFMQDGAPPHRPAENRQLLEDSGMTCIRGWPARSPDLNPIEHLWHMLKSAVARRGPTSLVELRQFVFEEWRLIPQEVVDALVVSFESRLRKCITMKGAPLY